MTPDALLKLTSKERGALDLVRRFGVGGKILMHRRHSGLRGLERAGIVKLTPAGDRWLVEIVEGPE